jgi:hypothetical protein
MKCELILYSSIGFLVNRKIQPLSVISNYYNYGRDVYCNASKYNSADINFLLSSL